ncbi:MAG: helicase-exonuclease AddAB subunit AddA [Oscillospiraceae bacterium]
MSRQWTNDQRNAIESLGGTVLVSAAAGSGKTAVLVERVVKRLTDTSNPCDADKLLIVTFTRAATSEMRERIGVALSQKLKSDPTNTHLLRQQMLLPNASICTIDSFCNDLVRENFNKLSINPDFNIIDDSQRKLLADEAANEIIEELYVQDSTEFKELVELLFRGRDDAELAKCIIRLFNYSQAYAFPHKWLESAESAYCATDNLAMSSWGSIIFSYIINALEYCETLLENSFEIMQADETVLEKYNDSFSSDINQVKALKNHALNNDWDSVYEGIIGFDFIRIGTLPRGYESPVKMSVASKRSVVKDIIGKKLPHIMCCNSQEFADDLLYLSPIVSKLFEAVNLFEQRFSEKKKDKNTFDFSDITHLAIELLVTEINDKPQKTPLAKELSQRYVEILLDEYQDTNMAQDMLFSSISNDGNNLFMVGDVKQSIYRFRQAMPEIFIEKRDKFQIYKDNNYPSVINLDRNFRSRQGVVGMVNFIFSQLMSREVGEVYYDETEKLKFGADFVQHESADAELHILDISTKKETGEKSTEIEARYVANIISDMLANGFKVKGKNGEERPATYGDFCILLRSTKGRSELYARELLNNGIPAYTESSGGFFSTYEIKVMLSLLRVIDNPVSDVPLLSVLMSPVFAFSPDDIAKLRLADRNVPLYNCIVICAKSGNEQCKQFLSQIEILRRFSAALPVSELIRKVYEQTDYLCLALSMQNGESRHANLNLLLQYADNFDSNQANGLSAFIRYIDKLEEKDIELASAGTISPNANVVRIMSIHKSKGLEFPVCIIANCSGKFNKDSLKNNMILHSKLGVGFTRRDTQKMNEFPTAMHTASKLAVEHDEISEEMRVLYVAMTRAKEKLIAVLSLENTQGKIESLSSNIINNETIPAFAVQKSLSFAEWILYAALRHPDATKLRQLIPDVEVSTLPADFKLDIIFASNKAQEEEKKKAFTSTFNSEMLSEIIERAEYKYPFADLQTVTAKRAASQHGDGVLDTEYFASSRPAFMNKSGLTPAQRGTALHKFMQFSDYEKASQNSKSELCRLLEQDFLTKEEADAIDIKKVDFFFHSPLAMRIFESKNVMREKKFAVNMPIISFDDALGNKFANEQVLVQGIADCAFVEDGELVILDYKTDSVKSLDVLAERYKSQLKIYSFALNEGTGLKVKVALLYSFELFKSIIVL